MLQSQLFTKTSKDTPKDEVSRNAQLLVRAGFIKKEMAGVYSYLPLGLRVLRKIETIIRDEMNKIGGQEILMPVFHPKENWEKTGRWDTMDDLYKVVDKSAREIALGATHEEIVVPLAKQFISSYKDLPLYTYQIQNKFRMELRAKSGILRGREFMMKDLYSFHTDEKDLDTYYEKAILAYKNIFHSAGIGEKTFLTFASGGSFSKYSHEFQTLADAGEDIIHICDPCNIAINEEIIEEQNECPICGGSNFRKEKAIETGNIFKLKTKFSAPFDLSYKDEKGDNHLVIMGCYGIGLGRLMGAVTEVLADKKGLVWPKAIAPFSVHILSLNQDGEALKIYNALTEKGIEVLLDDRDLRAGEKFADADLIGIPIRVVVSPKSLDAGGVEVRRRNEDESRIISAQALMGFVEE
ncbi:prolyl-tRNA synthetase [Patescibacteria group bacterium]|nr:prolyl-tRNA synthetase [Patescibacteria group bacterium]